MLEPPQNTHIHMHVCIYIYVVVTANNSTCATSSQCNHRRFNSVCLFAPLFECRQCSRAKCAKLVTNEDAIAKRNDSAKMPFNGLRLQSAAVAAATTTMR